jgi:uncharacterized protein HemY
LNTRPLCATASATDDAEALLREAINRRWSVKLVVGYGMLGRGNATAQLATAEGWLASMAMIPICC